MEIENKNILHGFPREYVGVGGVLVSQPPPLRLLGEVFFFIYIFFVKLSFTS